MLKLFGKAKIIVLIMFVVVVLSFGAGFIAAKTGVASNETLRTSKLSQFNRNLENRVPLYGPLLQKYKTWERQELYKSLFQSRVVKAMFTIFFNNWIAANLTMDIRAIFVVPLALYPYGRFAQGVAMAQPNVPYQLWGALICEFGGYFLTICGTLCVLFWTIFYRKFGFDTRKRGFLGGLKFLGMMYAISAVFILFGSYIETMAILGATLR